MTRGYSVPARALHRVEDTVRRSRFITSIGPAPDSGAAQAFVESVGREFPDATHHCWGFVAGPPGSSAHIGLSDAGEPHGTAGRPILNTLLHSGVGEVVAVVTRYFGGAKLGKGGLGRAYAKSVAHALEALPVARKVEHRGVHIAVPFRCADTVFRLLEEIGARERAERYTPSLVEVTARVPSHEFDRLRGEIARVTSEEGTVEHEAPRGKGERGGRG